MLKKPILNVMTMLSLLGDQRCAITGVEDGAEDIGAIATRRGDAQVAVLIYHSRDQIMSSGEEHIELQFNNVPFERGMLTHYRIDAEHGDPFKVWEAMGAPRYPSPEQYAEMRRHQELAMLDAPQEVIIKDGTLSLSFDLPLPSVSLVLLSAKPSGAPGRVEGVRIVRYEGLLDQDEVMVLWQANHVWHDVGSRVLQTYEVLYADSPEGPFTRVNEVDVIDTAFLHVRDKDAGASRGGFYKIRAVDYWGRRGEASEVIAI
jgi:L-iduronidase